MAKILGTKLSLELKQKVLTKRDASLNGGVRSLSKDN